MLNCRVRNGDKVYIIAAPMIEYAKSVTILPFSDSLSRFRSTGMNGSTLFDDLKPYFLDKNRPVHTGDIFTISCRDTLVKSSPASEDIFPAVDVDFKVLYVEGLNGTDIDGAIVGPDTELVTDGDALDRNDDDDRFNQIGYEDVGGCGKQLAQIKELVELPLRHPKLFQYIGIPPPRGVLLYGPPGSGKTLLAKAVAAETGAYFFVLNGPEIMSKMAGESESNLRKVRAYAGL